MKKLLSIYFIVAFLLIGTISYAQTNIDGDPNQRSHSDRTTTTERSSSKTHIQADGTSDRRYRTSRHDLNNSSTDAASSHMTDGAPDRRYRVNHHRSNYSSSRTNSHMKDGNPNRHDRNNTWNSSTNTYDSRQSTDNNNSSFHNHQNTDNSNGSYSKRHLRKDGTANMQY